MGVGFEFRSHGRFLGQSLAEFRVWVLKVEGKLVFIVVFWWVERGFYSDTDKGFQDFFDFGTRFWSSGLKRVSSIGSSKLLMGSAEWGVFVS